jgi:hypothetical protein
MPKISRLELNNKQYILGWCNVWGKNKSALKPFIIEGVTGVQKHVRSIAACTTVVKDFRVRSPSYGTYVGRQLANSMAYER